MSQVGKTLCLGDHIPGGVIDHTQNDTDCDSSFEGNRGGAGAQNDKAPELGPRGDIKLVVEEPAVSKTLKAGPARKDRKNKEIRMFQVLKGGSCGCHLGGEGGVAGDGTGVGGGATPRMEADLIRVQGPLSDLTLIFDRIACHPAPCDCFSVVPLAAERRQVPRPPP